ncbi:NmrA family NAD(P)-binding protein [Altererythrobacter sp. BO-6]|uniref:SDR family oxidoreductase n=1 Tax=Altererythrobacter sp. BO-6 TaxID=2604537 RepID=UPI0013E1D67C|nr:NmrA family NAD(P)-binding protein [Altererythrobacter sp. BO-6]QIG53637.1 NmrA family NAD(P)-binding protein [Altererythrobacter sp. BO-6]
MTGPLLLTGANGRTGRAILKSMAAASIPVRVFIRDEAKADALLDLGASEVAVGNLEAPETLRAAVEGAAKVLHIGPPMYAGELEASLALIDASMKAGVAHFIYYSVMHPLSRIIRHHRLKLEVEELLINSGLTHTILQPSRYMQHLEPIWPKVVSEGVHAMPFDVTRKFNVVDLADLADACAVVAGSDRYNFGTYELAGPEALSQEDMAAIISEVIGRPVEARAVPIDEMKARARAAGASDDRVEQMEIMNRHYDAHGFRSNSVVLECLLGRPANTYRSYVERVAAEKGAAL